MRKSFLVVGLWLFTLVAKAEVIPPAPTHYFNDFASVISVETVDQLDKKLQQLEKETSAQVVVAIYPKMQTESSIEDYTLRIAEKWGVGQKGKDNGAVLFVFIQDRKMFLQVGYGLEEKIPDALAKQIIEYEIKPEFKKADYDLGLIRGVTSIEQSIKSELQTNEEHVRVQKKTFPWNVVHRETFLIIGQIVLAIGIWFFLIYGVIYQILKRLVKTKWFASLPGSNSGGSTSFGGSRSSWSSSSSSRSSFSGGGGRFGGGGAGGSW